MRLYRSAGLYRPAGSNKDLCLECPRAGKLEGIQSPRAFNTLRFHKQESKVDLMFLMETRCGQEKIERWHLKLGYNNKLVVNSVGKSGGLCLIWDNSIDVSLLSYSQGHIDVSIKHDSNRSWRFTGFYGHPDQSQRTHSWTLLRRLAGMVDLLWVCMGDFNEVMADSEKFGGLKKKWQAIAEFREAVADSNLEDMGFSGPIFTWSNKRGGTSTILERLDRGLFNDQWKSMFQHFTIRHLDFWGSDHRPLLLDFAESISRYDTDRSRKGGHFFYEDC